MSDTKHIPGPWSYWPNCVRDGGMITQDKTGVHIAAPTYCSKFPELTEANARLIAAAPDMLDALKTIIEVGITGPSCDAVRAAIAKAERKK